jgi:hypothetical protein
MDLTDAVHSSARSHQGFRARLKGVARAVAVVIGLSLSMASMPRLEASIEPIKVLANYQLTDKQYLCHNEIIYRESRWNIDAVNGSHHGYYQLKIKAVKGKPYDYQFWMYWYYVTHRYGVTKYDEPNYCAALKHLQIKGWQWLEPFEDYVNAEDPKELKVMDHPALSYGIDNAGSVSKAAIAYIRRITVKSVGS